MSVISKDFKKKARNTLIYILIICLTLIIFLALISAATGLEINKIGRYFIFSTIGSRDGLLFVLNKTTILLIVGIGLIIAFRSSVWNIGAEGQMAIGAITSVGVGLFLHIPAELIIFFGFAGSFIFSGIWGGLAGLLKAKWQVPEIPITLMQNFVALGVLNYLFSDVWMSEKVGYARTDFIPEAARMPFIANPLNSTFILALALVPLTFWLMDKTTIGYQLQAVGLNREAARFAGINVKNLIIISMFLSGGVAGLAGASLVFGEFFRGQLEITGNYGYYAIVSTLLAKSKPELIVFSSFLVSLILVGTINLSVIGVPARFTHLLMGILFIASCIPIIFEKGK